jgi:hypothetical protein
MFNLNQFIMTTTSYSRKAIRNIVLLLVLLCTSWQHSWAQCGSISSYVPTVSSNTGCTGNYFYVYATGLPVTTWIYRDNNTGPWNVFAYNADNASQYISISSPATRTYKAVLSTPSCPTDTTLGVSVSLTPSVYGNDNSIKLSANSTQICAGGQLLLRTMNQGLMPVSWVYSDNGSTWTNFSTTTSSELTLTAPNTATPVNRLYKVLVKNASSCQIDSSASILIHISPSTPGYNPNVAPSSTQNTICGGTSVSLQVDWPYEIGNWIYKDAGSNTWQVFSSNSIYGYDYSTNISQSGMREYRVVLKDPNNCAADTSAPYFVMINASVGRVLTAIQPRLNATATQVCAGSSMQLRITGYSNIAGWYYRDSANGNWTYFSTSSQPSLSSNNNITKDLLREVRVVINNSASTCSYDTSTSVFYTVKANIKGNSTTIPYTPIDVLSVGVQPTLYLQNGQQVSTWLYRNNNLGAWTNTFSSSNTYSDFSTSNFTTNTSRTYKAVINNTATCRLDTTQDVSILYKIAVAGGSIAITPTVTTPAYCSGATITGNINIANNRQITKWIYRDNNATSWLEVASSASTNFYDYNTTVTGATVREYKALIRSFETFTIDTSDGVKVDINQVSRGNIGIVPTATIANICNGNNIQLNIVPASGYTVNNWIYRDTVTSTWINLGSSSNTISNNIATNNSKRNYRVLLINSSICKYDTTNELSVKVLQRTTRNNSAIQPTVTEPSVCGGTAYYVNINITSGSQVSRWVYRDNNSAWKTSTSSSTSFYDNSTKVLVPTNREYKVVVNDNENCFSDTSAGVVVSINPMSNGAMSGITPTTATSIVCAGSTFNANISYNGAVQKWVFRENGGMWNEFTQSTGSTSLYINSIAASANVNREFRAYLMRPNSCVVDTTQALQVQVRPFTNGNADAIQPSASAVNVCSGNQATLFIATATGYTPQKWIYKNGLNGEWKEILSSTSSTNFYESNTAVNSNTLRTYRSIIRTNTCSYDTTAPVSVQLNARTYGYANGTTVTSNSGVYCSSAAIGLNAISMPASSGVRSWLYMDNGNWMAIANSTGTFLNHANTSVTAPTTRSYRLIVNNTSTCSYDSSSVFSVSINQSGAGYATTITPTIFNATVCNSNLNPNVNISLPSGFSMVKWIVNTNNQGWSDFGYPATGTNVIDYNVAVQQPVSRSYRAIVTNTNTCSLDSTNTIGASINPAVSGVLPTVAPTSVRSNYCYTKGIQASISVPSGYTVEQWIYSDNNGSWNAFTSSTASSNLTDNNTYVSSVTSRSYRVIMFNNNTCQRDTTAALTVVISPRSNNISTRAVTPTSNPVAGICSGNSVSLTVAPGTGNELLKWTYSDNGSAGPWYDALGSYNQNTFSHQLTQVFNVTPRLYRAIITDTATCDFDSTQAVVVNIQPITYGIDTSISITGADSVCVGSAVSLSVSPGSGNSVTKWIYNDNDGPWKNFTASTQSNSLFDANTSLAPGSRRGYSPLILKGALCRIDTLSKVKSVNFKSKTYGISTTSATITVDTLCAGNTLNASTSGTVEKWLFRDGTTGNWNSIASTSTFLSHAETGVTTSVWRYYRALLNTGSCNADSSKTDSVYIRILSKGNLAFAPTTGNTTVCSGNSVNINLSAPSGSSMQRWLYRDNGVGNWNMLGTTTSFAVVDYNTSVLAPISREYRAIVLRTCSYDTTNALTVTITPKSNGTDLTKIPSASSANVCAASNVQNIQVNAGSGNTIVQWLSRNNGGAWQVFANGNQNNLTDYNTYVGQQIVRDYVAIINNNTTCKLDTSAKLTVTIKPIVLGNSNIKVAAPATACMNNSYTVSLNVSADTSVIRFLSSYNGGAWSDEGYISPTNNASLNKYAYTGSAYSIAYRAVTYKASSCNIDTTSPVTVSVIPRSYGNDNSVTPTAVNTVCSGTNVDISLSSNTLYTISHWVYSDDAITWTPYYSSSFNINAVVNTNAVINRQYRAILIKLNSCSIDTSAAKTITFNPIVNGTDVVSQISISNGTSACIGSTISVGTSSALNSINQWLYSDNGGSWHSLYQNGNSISDGNTFVSSPVSRRYTAILWKQASCALDTISQTDTIDITPRTYGTDNTIGITPSNNSICIGTAISLSANTGSHSVQTWYVRDNGGMWNVLSNSTSSSLTDYNTGVAVSTTRDYRALIRKSNACALDTTLATTVTINPRSVGADNTIIPTVTGSNICSGKVVTVNVNAGSGNTIQKWIYRQNGGAWADFMYTSATSINDYNTNVSVSTTREYRAIIVKGSGCKTDTSALVLVTISPIGFGNQNSIIPTASKASICSGSTVTLSVNGFTGSSVLRWLYKDNASAAWTELYSSATSITDFNTQTSSSFVRQYRAVINNNVSGCSTDTTAATSVSVSPITNGTIAIPTTVSQSVVCAGGPVNVLINPTSGSKVVSWLYKDAGSDWTVFSNTSSTSINDFNTNITANTIRDYRAIVSNAAGCSLDSSGSVSVNINMITAGNNLSITPNTSTPNLCSGSTAIVGVSGFSGNVVNWIYRDTVTVGWSSIGNTNFTLFHASTFVSYPRTRTYRAIVYNANNCSYDTTAAVQVQINPLLAGNANSIAPTSASTKACSGSSLNMSATGFINGGVVTGWMFSDNGITWTLFSNGGTSVNHAINVNGPTTRQYRALVLTGCTPDTTASLTVSLDKLPAKPSITKPAGTDSLICSETATTYEWRLNGNIIPGATGQVHVATVSGTYSVQIGNASDCKTLSDDFIHSMVGLEKVFANTRISVYPNPTTTGNVTIEWQGLSVEKAKLIVMDMLGKIVLETEIETQQSKSADIDLSQQSAGMYFITLSSKGDAVTRKISYVR